jgi:hypothetical protein
MRAYVSTGEPGRKLTLSYSLSGTRGWKEVADDIRYRWNAAQIGTGDAASYNDQFPDRGAGGRRRHLPRQSAVA